MLSITPFPHFKKINLLFWSLAIIFLCSWLLILCFFFLGKIKGKLCYFPFILALPFSGFYHSVSCLFFPSVKSDILSIQLSFSNLNQTVWQSVRALTIWDILLFVTKWLASKSFSFYDSHLAEFDEYDLISGTFIFKCHQFPLWAKFIFLTQFKLFYTHTNVLPWKPLLVPLRWS